MGELRQGLDEVLAGHGRVFLIVGEPGIGKTRLAEETARLASEAGALVCWGRCWEGGGAPAFWPWVQVLRHLARELDGATLAAAMGDGAARIAALAPEIAATEGATGATTTARSPVIASEHERFPLFDAFTAFLRRLSAERPLVLVLDDLHAADDPSLLLLEFLAREIRDARLLVLGTYRDVEVQRQPEHARLLNAVARCGQRLPLGGLTEIDVERLVRAALGAPASEERVHRLVERVHRTSEGNPFFVDEILRLLLAEPPNAAGEPRIPAGIRETVRERLRPLAAECQKALGAAAVIGREFDLALLQALVERTWNGEGAAATLLTTLGAAEVAGVVTRAAGAVARWSFCHGLLRDTLYEDLPPARRAQLHWELAETLATESAGARDAVPLAEIAHHYLRGAAVGDARKAVEYAARAGERAMALLAYEEAAASFQKALEAIALVRREEGDALDVRRVMLQLALGEAQGRAWNTTSAQQTFTRAAEQARALYEHAPEAAAALVARAALGFGGTGLGVPRGNTSDPALVALLDEALRLLGDSQPALRARVLARFAVELYFSGETERRMALSEEAVRLARQEGDVATLAYVVCAQHFALWDSPDVERRLALACEAIELAQRARDPDVEAAARLWRVLDRIEKGDGARWEAELDELDEFARKLRQPRMLVFAATLRATRALWRGRLAEVEAFGQRCLEIGQRAQDSGATLNVAIQRFALQRVRGEQAEQMPLVEMWMQQMPSNATLRCMRALLCADLDRREEAREELDRIAASDFADLRRVNGLPGQLAWLSEVCAYLGDRRRAELLQAYLRPYATAFLLGGPRIVFGPASHWLGVLAGVLGNLDEALEYLTAAAERSRALAGAPAAAWSEYEMARLLRRRGAAGDRDRAAVLCERAASTAAELGLAFLARRIEQEERTPAPQDERAALRVAAGGGAAEAAPGGGRGASGGRVLRFPGKASGRGTSQAPRSGAATYTLRCEGEFWTVSDGESVLRLKDTKGLRYLGQLLRHPDREFHVLDLIAPERDAGDRPAAGMSGLSERQLGDLGMHSAADAESGEKMLDAQARAAYQRRLEDLREDLEEATRFNDTERASRARIEMEFLAAELARAVGLGGRDRAMSSGAERARLNVTRAIKAVVRRIARSNPNLGRYLETTVRTGTFCSYRPDARIGVKWVL